MHTDSRFGPPKEILFTVPSDYNHDAWLDTFAKETKKLKTTYHFNDALNSTNFAGATNKLKPGQIYKVKFFPMLARIPSEDCMIFLAKQHAILVGGQGLTLLQQDRSDEFPMGSIVSFDKKDFLWKDSNGYHRVPSVDRYSHGKWKFDLEYFEDYRGGPEWMLCFCEA